MTSPEPLVPERPTEDVRRGVLFALIVVPLGIGLWLLLWSFGFLAAITAVGIAIGAVVLYRRGSHNHLGKRGALWISLITIATSFGGFAIALGVNWAVSTAARNELILAIVLTVALTGGGVYLIARSVDEPEEERKITW